MVLSNSKLKSNLADINWYHYSYTSLHSAALMSLFIIFIIQFQSGVFLVTEGGRMHVISSVIALTPSLHLVRFAASSTSNPILFTLSLTCLLHVCFGLPRFRCPFISSINVLFRMLSPSSLLTTCLYLLHSLLPF